MRALIFSLCFLLMFAPAQGQQDIRQSQPNFYVPYGVRDLPVAPIDEEFSSSDARYAEPTSEPFAALNAPMPRRYPVRRGHFPSFRAGYTRLPQPEFTATEAFIILGIVALCAGIAISRQ